MAPPKNSSKRNSAAPTPADMPSKKVKTRIVRPAAPLSDFEKLKAEKVAADFKAAISQQISNKDKKVTLVVSRASEKLSDKEHKEVALCQEIILQAVGPCIIPNFYARESINTILDGVPSNMSPPFIDDEARYPEWEHFQSVVDKIREFKDIHILVLSHVGFTCDHPSLRLWLSDLVRLGHKVALTYWTLTSHPYNHILALQWTKRFRPVMGELGYYMHLPVVDFRTTPTPVCQVTDNEQKSEWYDKLPDWDSLAWFFAGLHGGKAGKEFGKWQPDDWLKLSRADAAHFLSKLEWNEEEESWVNLDKYRS